MLARLAVTLALVQAACAASARPIASIEPSGPRPGHGQVVGLVRDATTGAPLAFAHVAAIDPQGHARDDLSDAAGRFAIELLPGGYQVTVRYGTRATEVPDLIVLDGRATELAVELEASPRPQPPSAAGTVPAPVADGAIAGVVYDVTSGERFPGAVIAVTAPSLPDALMAMTDERGAYRVFGLPPDRYQVSVYYHLIDRGNLELRQGPVAVASGETTTVDLAIDLRVER